MSFFNVSCSRTDFLYTASLKKKISLASHDFSESHICVFNLNPETKTEASLPPDKIFFLQLRPPENKTHKRNGGQSMTKFMSQE
jgi:hypothetical protein